MTRDIVCKRETECILSEFDLFSVFFNYCIFLFALFQRPTEAFSSTVVTRVIVCKSKTECILSEFNDSVLVFFKCCIVLFAGVWLPFSHNILRSFLFHLRDSRYSV